MNKLNIWDKIRFPDHGKNLLVIEDGELKRGGVIWGNALIQNFESPKLNEADKLRLIIEAANGLRVPTSKVQGRLDEGKMVLYRGHERG